MYVRCPHFFYEEFIVDTILSTRKHNINPSISFQDTHFSLPTVTIQNPWEGHSSFFVIFFKPTLFFIIQNSARVRGHYKCNNERRLIIFFEIEIIDISLNFGGSETVVKIV